MTSRAVDHTLQVIDLGENRFRFFSFSQTQSNFSGQSGSILTFQIFLNANPGSFQTQLFNPVLGNENSVNIVSSFSNGQITVIGSKAIYNPTIIDLDGALESEQSFELLFITTVIAH